MSVYEGKYGTLTTTVSETTALISFQQVSNSPSFGSLVKLAHFILLPNCIIFFVKKR